GEKCGQSSNRSQQARGDASGEGNFYLEIRRDWLPVRVTQEIIGPEAVSDLYCVTAANSANRSPRDPCNPWISGVPVAPQFAFWLKFYSNQLTLISTLRFLARPSAVAFEAIGFDSPNP